MPEFLPGVELSRRYYTEAVRPLLGTRPHAAARLGPGSDVLGFDSARSTDHDWGPRLELFVDDPAGLSAWLRDHLPHSFLGWPTNFEQQPNGVRALTPTTAGPVNHFITVTTWPSWSTAHLGFDPGTPPALLDWLATPWQRFAEITSGAVFHDPDGTLTATRSRLRWYPGDVWRYVLACQWKRIAEEEAFPGRAAEAGDPLGARVEITRLARLVAQLLLLLDRRWPPYPKWQMYALRTDPAATHLRAAVESGDLAELCTAYEIAATRQNALPLSAPQPATRRPFHDRGYQVIDAARYTQALRAEISDPLLRAMPLSGAIDQFADNTDILTNTHLTRPLIRSLLPG